MSKRDEDYNYVVASLTDSLRGHSRVTGGARRMTFTTLPLSTDAKLDHVELKHIVTPPVPADGILTEQLLDAWVYPMVDGESTPEKSLGEISDKMLVEFVGAGPTFGEQTVRLIHALGNAEGAETTYDKHSIMVRHDGREFGLQDGAITSRFCTGIEIGNVNPLKVITQSFGVRTYDQSFCSLYREAYRKGNYMVNALVAVAMRDASFNWRKLAHQAVPKRYPAYEKLQRWEAILNCSADPLGTLYTKIVPKWMSSAEFSKTFGPVMQRSVTVRKDTINKWVNSMYAYFHKNNNQE